MVAILAAICFAAAPDTKPDFSGTWKLNVEKSNYGPMPAPTSLEQVIVHKDPDLTVTTKESRPEGDSNNEMKMTTDGKESTNTLKTPQGDLPIKTVLAWEGPVLTSKSKFEIQGMEIGMNGKWTLSEDGKVLTVNSSITTPQGDLDMTQVFEKVVK